MDGYRDWMARCPRCGEDLDHRGDAAGCRRCRGVCVPEPKLDEMLREMHDQPVAPSYVARAATERLTCPSCQTPMKPVVLHGVQVDRCEAGHGVWFDSDELESALRAAAGAETTSPPEGVPTVKIGFGRALLRGLGSILGLFGYAAAGAVMVMGAADPRRR